MSDIILHVGNKNYSSWSLRAWLVAKHCGAQFRTEQHDITEGSSRASIREVSPSGRVPALLDGDLCVWDSLAIAERLAERFPDACLWPADAEARGVARSITAEMHSGFPALRSNMPMNIRRRSPGAGMAPGVQHDIDRIFSIWMECRARFGQGGDFLFGRFSIADAFYAPVVTRLRTYGVELPPAAAAYCAAIWALPAMQEWETGALAEGGVDPKYDR